MASQPFRVNFRIRPSDDLEAELDRLARIISTKYQKDVRIVLREVRRR